MTFMYSGKDLQTIRKEILAELENMQTEISDSMWIAIDMAQQAFVKTGSKDDYVVAGQTNLISVAELSNVENLKKLFEGFNQRRDILHLLEQTIHAEGVQIFIGDKSGYLVMRY